MFLKHEIKASISAQKFDLIPAVLTETIRDQNSACITHIKQKSFIKTAN